MAPRVWRDAVALVSVTLLCLSCSGHPGPKLAARTGEIDLLLLGFRSPDGHAVVSLYSDTKGFPDQVDKSLLTQVVDIDADRASVRLGPLAWGRYAISVLHDENDDGRMNSSWLGTPREGFGFSGYPEYRFGQPDYQETAFLLATERLDMTIKIRYATGRQERRQHNLDSQLNRPGD